MSYVFCRVSTGRGCSLDYQEAKIREVTESLKWNIKETIKYVGSAYNETPEPLIRLSKLKNKKIVFYCVDRFSRNYLKGFALATEFLKNKNELYFIVEKLKVTRDAGDEWEAFCKYLTYAEAESKKIAKRVTDSKEYLKSKGYFTESAAPFGYKKIKLANGRAKLAIDPSANKVLQFIDECKSPGTSLKQLNKTLAECGGDTKRDPILLDEGTKKLETDLRYENIAELLEDYEISGSPWTASKVSRIYKNHSVQSMAADFNIKTSLSNSNSKSKTKNGTKRKRTGVFDD